MGSGHQCTALQLNGWKSSAVRLYQCSKVGMGGQLGLQGIASENLVQVSWIEAGWLRVFTSINIGALID